MSDSLYTLEHANLVEVDESAKTDAGLALESGKVVYLPCYPFQFSLMKENAQNLLSERILDGKHKNISFSFLNQRLGGLNQHSAELSPLLTSFMQDFAQFSKHLVDALFPHYKEALAWGRTSYRPAEIKQRVSSKRKDDKRLHVDAFAATPVNGLRILRVFSNINPFSEPRVWHLGETYPKVLEQFASRVPAYSSFKARCLHWLKATKSKRSAYDHYQLQLHDRMKLDDEYQQTVSKDRVEFPAESTWVVFTDQVSHAALSGQFLLEQTFYLPVRAMKNPESSPLKHWEKLKKVELVD